MKNGTWGELSRSIQIFLGRVAVVTIPPAQIAPVCHHLLARHPTLCIDSGRPGPRMLANSAATDAGSRRPPSTPTPNSMTPSPTPIPAWRRYPAPMKSAAVARLTGNSSATKKWSTDPPALPIPQSPLPPAAAAPPPTPETSAATTPPAPPARPLGSLPCGNPGARMPP